MNLMCGNLDAWSHRFQMYDYYLMVCITSSRQQAALHMLREMIKQTRLCLYGNFAEDDVRDEMFVVSKNC